MKAQPQLNESLQIQRTQSKYRNSVHTTEKGKIHYQKNNFISTVLSLYLQGDVFCVFFYWTVFAHLFSVFHHTVVCCQIGKRVSRADGIWLTCRPMWQCSWLSTMRRNLRTHRNLRGRPQSSRLLEKVLCSAALAGSQIHISVTRFIPHLLL